jgi:hypothetical protein
MTVLAAAAAWAALPRRDVADQELLNMIATSVPAKLRLRQRLCLLDALLSMTSNGPDSACET